MEQSSDPSASPAASLAFAHYQCAKQLEALSCQEARLQRTFDKSLRELERLQALPGRRLKTELENQTQSAVQPEENRSAAAEAHDSENQTQSAIQPEENHSAAAEAHDSENQTQSPVQPEESRSAAAEARDPENQTQCSPATPSPGQVEAASRLIARVFAQLPKTA